MAGESSDPPIMDENTENMDIETKQRIETFNNFPLVLCPYDDRLYFEDLEQILRGDQEDFKRVVHAHLLSNGTQELGWDMKMLKTTVKDSMGYKENKDVDAFVSEHFKIKTFTEFIGKATDIAIVTEEGLVKPFIDDTNRDLYEDAVASARNKDEKDRRKMEQLEANMDQPEHVKEFYEGMNRVRAAVLVAQEKYQSREGALAKISAMDGTTGTVVGVNFNFVGTEYKLLYGVELKKEEVKKICGRSTLMKGLAQGKPQCLVETFAMETKDLDDLEPGEKPGAYIALKTTSKEYTEAEIEAAVEACKQVRSQTNYKLNKRTYEERRGGGGGRSEQPRERNADLRREMNQQREQREQMAASRAAAPQGAPAPPRPTNPSNMDDSGELDAIARQVPSTSNKNTMRTSPVAEGDERYEGESSDDERGQIYSDEEESVQRHEEKEDKRKMKQKKLEQSSIDDSHYNHPPVSSHLAPLPTPASSSHPEVPYGQLPPAPIVLRHDADERVTIDDLLEAAASNTLARHAAPSRSATQAGGNVNQQNAWEKDDEETEQASPLQQVQQQQQPAAAAPASQGIFAPRPIPAEAYLQNGQQQQQPPQPVQQQQGQQMQQQQPPYDPQQMQQQQPFVQQQQPQPYAPQPGFEGQQGLQPMAPFPPHPTPMAQMAGGMMPAPIPPQQPYYGPQGYPQQQQPYQGQYYQQGAYSQSQSDFGGGMPTQPQFHPQGAPLPPPGQYPGGRPLSPQYPPMGPPQGDSYYAPGAPPPAQPGYGPAYGTHSPTINVVVNNPGPEFPHQTPGHPNYHNPQAPPPPGPGYGGAPQGAGYAPVPQGPGGHQAGAPPPQRHEYAAAPPQGRGHPGPPFPTPQGPPPGGYQGGRPHPQDYPQDYGRPAHRNSPPMDPVYGGPGGRGPERRGPVYDDHARAPPPVQRLRHPSPPRQLQQQRHGHPHSHHQYQEPSPPPVARRRDEMGFGEEMDRRGGQNRGAGQRYDNRGFGEPDRGFGEDRRDRGFGEMNDRHGGAQDRRRDPPLGRPQGASTPINRSREYGGGPTLWETAGVNRINDAKKRIRWQIILILKNLLDKNRGRLSRGDREFEMIEVETTLYQLVTMGCGNDMDFHEATAPYLDMEKPLREFLREMQRDRLVRLYSCQTRKGKTNAYEEVVYVTDPFMQPPAHFNLTPYY